MFASRFIVPFASLTERAVAHLDPSLARRSLRMTTKDDNQQTG